MGSVTKDFAEGKPIYVGVDVHKKDWVVTVLCQGEELYQATVVQDGGGLVRSLRGFKASEVQTVYEAGPTGYNLDDAFTEAGFDSIVTPPSLVPRCTSSESSVGIAIPEYQILVQEHDQHIQEPMVKSSRFERRIHSEGVSDILRL